MASSVAPATAVRSRRRDCSVDVGPGEVTTFDKEVVDRFGAIPHEVTNGWSETDDFDIPAEPLDDLAFAFRIEHVAVGHGFPGHLIEYLLQVCTTLSCQLCGTTALVEHLKDRLDIDFGETTEDGCFTLIDVQCLGACGEAPVVQINNDYYTDLNAESLDKLLDGLAAQ